MKRIGGISRRALVAGAVLVLALIAAHQPAGAATLRDVAQAAADWRALPASAPAEPGTILATLVRSDALPLRCGTPLVLSFSSAPENGPLTRSITRRR